MLVNESFQPEKQVSVDPISIIDTSHQLTPSPIKPLPSLPTKYKFLSTSLPSSPRIGSSRIRPDNRSCDSRLQRSKSGGEHRSSVPHGSLDISIVATGGITRSSTKHGDGNEGFKCGALCLFLPGFGKGKVVRARRVEPGNVISQRVSLEKFECGSWRSSAIQGDDDHSSGLYFDLPLELIRTGANDSSLPTNSAFVFDKSVKGVLKMGGGSRKSQEGRSVRFSTAQPTSPSSCITPRLHKARQDFNAFLEAQSA